MMVKKYIYKFESEKTLADISNIIAELIKVEAYEDFDIKKVIEAIGIGNRLVDQTKSEAEDKKDSDLEQFLKQALGIIANLRKIAKDEYKEAPEPSDLFKKLDMAFNNFINRALSKENKKSFRVLAESDKFVNNVIICCETLPVYWRWATKTEKLLLIISATLMVTALALVIAGFVNPALFIPAYITATVFCPLLGVGLYKAVLVRLQDRNTTSIDIKKSLAILNEQQEALKKLLDKIKAKKLPRETMLHTPKREKPEEQQPRLSADIKPSMGSD